MNILEEIFSFICDLFYVADNLPPSRKLFLFCGLVILIAILAFWLCA